MQRFMFKRLEGTCVTLRLHDGSLMDDCEVISAGRAGVSTLWVLAHDVDCFVPVDEILEIL